MIVDVIHYRLGEDWVEGVTLAAHRDVTNAGQSYAEMFMETDTLASLMGRLGNLCMSRGEAIRLLRIHSHGSPGRLLGGQLTTETARSQATVLSSLANRFTRDGEVYLMSCHVGQQPAILGALADAWQVPVTAGVEEQFVGAGATFVFEGRTITAVPGSRTYQFDRAGVPRAASGPPIRHQQP